MLREDIQRGFQKSGVHTFYRLESPYSEITDQFKKFEEKIANSDSAKSVEIRNIVHPEDDLNFMFLYNAIFIAAPDPSRIVTLEDVQTFPTERTLIATLWHTFAGFVYLTVEKDPMGSEEIVGAIAGIGVLPKYRGRKIGLLLLQHSIEFFKDKGIEKLICEVYEHNEASLKMFQSLGMKIVGHMILEDEQPNLEDINAN
ncbi:MAG: Mycothiol acetyltransferase [Candidatus Heimdallarchaeota archaeon LC_2]|nr:MAG: Mycothiol acetyltransferase [Candidatus Heimdallarchaeota archaeon LC_2]